MLEDKVRTTYYNIPDSVCSTVSKHATGTKTRAQWWKASSVHAASTQAVQMRWKTINYRYERKSDLISLNCIPTLHNMSVIMRLDHPWAFPTGWRVLRITALKSISHRYHGLWYCIIWLSIYALTWISLEYINKIFLNCEVEQSWQCPRETASLISRWQTGTGNIVCGYLSRL